MLHLLNKALRYPPQVTARRALNRAVALYRRPMERRADLRARASWTDERFWRAIGVPASDRASVLRRAWTRDDAVLPISNAGVEALVAWLQRDAESRARVEQAVAEAMAHRFDCFGTGAVVVGDRDRIDWHRDWRRGHHFDPAVWYRDVAIPAETSADIKFPRELSRFHHLPTMGLAARMADSFDAETIRAEAGRQLQDWVRSNPFRFGVNWQSAMDVAIRACNWLIAIPLLWPSGPRDDLRILLLQQLYLHGRHIESNLEYYDDGLTGNHYLSDVIGLLAIGAACPEFPDSDRWVAFGLQELASEASQQVRDDGTHVEDSSHYHRLVLEMFLAGTALGARLPAARRERIARVDTSAHRVRPPLRPIAQQPYDLSRPALFPASHYDRLRAMAGVTRALTKPDGLVPQFGDNDNSRLFRVVPRAAERRGDFSDHRDVVALAATILDGVRRDTTLDDAVAVALSGGVPAAPAREWNAVRGGDRTAAASGAARVTWRFEWTAKRAPSLWEIMPRGGYAVAADGETYVAVTFRGSTVSGHGHNDQLSFVLSTGGEDIVVDPGSYVYTSAPAERNRYRSTAMHNTVQIEDREQNDWDEGQRGLFEYRSSHTAVIAAGAGTTLTVALPSYGRYTRTFRLSPGVLIVEDAFDATAWASRLHLAPEVTVGADGDATLLLTPAGQEIRVRCDGGRVHTEPYRYSPAYGTTCDATVIVASSSS